LIINLEIQNSIKVQIQIGKIGKEIKKKHLLGQLLEPAQPLFLPPAQLARAARPCRRAGSADQPPRARYRTTRQVGLIGPTVAPHRRVSPRSQGVLPCSARTTPMLNNPRDLWGCCGPPRLLPLGFIYYPQLLLLLVSIHQSQDQTPSLELKRKPRAGSVRQRCFCPRLRPKGPQRVWVLLCVAWKVLMTRGGRIDHWGGQNFSPNIGFRRARRA
jgi:hypothetical protein